MAQVGEMWHQDLCSPKADRLYDSLEKSAIIIYPKALLEKSINLKSTKQNIVKRENRTSAPNTGTGIIAMTEISLASLNESVDVPLTDAWGYEFSSRRELLSAPKFKISQELFIFLLKVFCKM
jgi:hypothetical protein